MRLLELFTEVQGLELGIAQYQLTHSVQQVDAFGSHHLANPVGGLECPVGATGVGRIGRPHIGQVGVPQPIHILRPAIARLGLKQYNSSQLR